MSATKQSFIFIAPPSMPIMPGATTPLSKPGATTWSTLVDAELIFNGSSWQYPPQSQNSRLVSVITLLDGRLLQLDDAFSYMRVNASMNVSLGIPTNAQVPFALGTYVEGVQAGEGGVAFVPSSGVTLNVASSFVTADYVSTRTMFSGFNLVKVGTNEWDLMGDVLSMS